MFGVVFQALVVGVEYPLVSLLKFGKLWISVIASIYSKKKSLDEQ